jgi:MerR family mercuric resistance operon transcriptional regulator
LLNGHSDLDDWHFMYMGNFSLGSIAGRHTYGVELRGGDMDWTIGEIAHRAGVNVETIRYYEREGIMPQAPRTAGGRRLYAPDDLKTLTFIRKARDLGFNLDDTRALLALRGPDNECADVKAIALKHLEIVRRQKSRIIEVERLLSDAVARCPGGPTKNCSLLALLEPA